MRSIWKGAITFGLVNVPVKVYSATEDHDISLHQVHDEDGGRIRYQRRCEVCGKVVAFENIDKAYDDGERTVIITKEDLKSLPEERSREIDVVEFVPSEQLDPIMFDRSYYLEPDSKSSKAYVLLRRTLEESDRTAIVHFALRQKTRLAALRVRGDVLVLQTLLWDDEVREADFPGLSENVTLHERELEMSAALVKSFESDFEPEKFSDNYQEQLRTLIEAKLEQGESLDTDATFGQVEDGRGGGEVLDLMEALRRSVEKSRGDKASGGEKDGGSGRGKGAAKSAGSTAKSSSKAAAKADAGEESSTKSASAKSGAKSSAKSASTKSSTTKSSSTKASTAKSSAGESTAKKTTRKPAARKGDTAEDAPKRASRAKKTA